MPGVGGYSSVAWGDYDNDGDLDILLTGSSSVGSLSRIYRNSGGANPTFTDIAAGLTGVSEASVAWGDYDKDGDLDILLTGYTGTGFISRIYRNSGGSNPTFTDISAGLPAIGYHSSAAWGDYDNDGDLDILMSGGASWIYRNSGGADPTFSDIGAALPGVGPGSVAWGDYDNDGDLDILLTGPVTSTVYENSGGANPTFTDIGAGLQGVWFPSVAWGDYDNDGDLDILLTGEQVGGGEVFSKIYQNSGAPTNTPPEAPGNLVAAGNLASGITFSWTAPSDDHTPAAGLTYNLRVGNVSSNEGSPAMASDYGYRRVVRRGNADHRMSWHLALPAGNYNWSVQAIDGAFAGSEFAPGQMLNVLPGAFADIAAGLPGTETARAAWGDYDNDGDLDILLTGYPSSGGISQIYRNSGGANPTFTDSGVWVPGSSYASVAWGDYDNDGDLDILMSGGSIARIYRNSGGADPTFTDIGAGLDGGSWSTVAWGDYDNDGDLDLLLTGLSEAGDPTSRIYRNSGGANPTFADIGAGLTGIYRASIAWGDYDDDGDLDILLTGTVVSGGYVSMIYRNSGGANPTFTDIGAGLPAVGSSSAAWGDYDNDGDLDILLTGTGVGIITKVYRNSGGVDPTFTDIAAGLPGVFWSAVAWGDYDNDGDLDILLTGTTGSVRISRIYQNSGEVNPTFTDIGAGLTGVYFGSVAWGDCDNDGDLDILLTGDTGAGSISRIYRNIGVPANTPPQAPGNPESTGDLASGCTFSWTAPTDDHTPAAGLTYNLRVGTTPGGDQVSAAMAAANGYRRVVQLGNTNHRLSWNLALPRGSYYWAVQALDGAFAGSAFATGQILSVSGVQTPEAPRLFALGAASPNPFNPATTIRFALPQAQRVRLAVYDLGGRLVRVLVDEDKAAGSHEVQWNGTDDRGQLTASGVYVCRMEAGSYRESRRMTLVK